MDLLGVGRIVLSDGALCVNGHGVSFLPGQNVPSPVAVVPYAFTPNGEAGRYIERIKRVLRNMFWGNEERLRHFIAVMTLVVRGVPCAGGRRALG